MAFWADFADVDGELRCLVEDDDRVGYAYLCDTQGVVADVWLYNVAASGSTPEWSQGAPTPPFLNPRGDFSEEPLRRLAQRHVSGGTSVAAGSGTPWVLLAPRLQCNHGVHGVG